MRVEVSDVTEWEAKLAVLKQEQLYCTRKKETHFKRLFIIRQPLPLSSLTTILNTHQSEGPANES